MESGMVLAGRYRLEERLGRGGMGEVWQGRDLRLNRGVAVKIVLPGLASDPQLVTRLLREAENAAAVDHPGATMVHDVGEHEGTPFFVMELLKGEDLTALLSRRREGLPVEQVVSIGRQAAETLAAAHAQGVVHRDIKPANLMVLPDGRVKVCDFGISRFSDATSGLTGSRVVGTPSYMAPEQFKNQPADARTDLYSLGCTLYTLLTGRAPFVSDSMHSLIYQHLSAQPDSLSMLRSDIPPSLERLVMELLSKEPEDRPADAEEVVRRLGEALPAPAPEQAGWAPPQSPDPGTLSEPGASPLERVGSVPPGAPEPGVSARSGEALLEPLSAPREPLREKAPPAAWSATASAERPGRTASRRLVPWVAAGVVAVLVPVLFLALQSDFSSKGSSGAEQKPSAVDSVSLGFMGDLTGENASLVLPMKNGAQLAIDQYNATGPEVEIELVSYDSQAKPEKAASLAENAIGQDGIVGLIGPAFSGESAQVGSILEEAKIPSVTPSAANAVLAENGWKYWHRVISDDDVQGVGLGEFITNGVAAKKVFIVHDGTDYGQSLAETVKTTVEKGGADAQEETIDPKTTDHGSTIGEIKAFDPDAVFFGGCHREGNTLLAQLRSSGIYEPFLGGDCLLDPGLVTGVGGTDRIFVSCTCLIDPEGSAGETSKKFADAYQAQFNVSAEIYAAEAYDVATVFIKAVQSGATTAEAIQEFISAVDFTGVSKQIKFQANGEPASGDVYMYQARGGSFSLLGDARSVVPK